MRRLLQTVFTDRERTVQWLVDHNIFPEVNTCPKCGSPMRWRPTLSQRPDGDDICTNIKCRCRRSPRGDSFFRELSLSPEIFCEIVIHWLGSDPRDRIAAETEVSKRTVSRYMKLIRIACVILLKKKNTKIGGPGKVVEIDEALLHRRKYERGRMKESGWVVGGIERPTRVTVHVCFWNGAEIEEKEHSW